MNKKTCIIAAPFATRSGYGDHSRDIIRSLIQVKGDEWNIQLLSLPWGNCPMNSLTVNDNDLTERMIINKRNINIPDIWIQITIPSEFVAQGKYLNIGITAGIETTSFHPKWIQGSNNMDLIIVPSEHSKNVLINTSYEYEDKDGSKKKLKFNKNVEVLFEGLDENIFYKTNEIHKTVNDSLNDVKEKFAFLFVGHWLEGFIGQDRKDVGGLVHTFIESFKNKKDKPALILKTSGANFSEPDLYRIREKLNLITKETSVPIYLIHGDLSPNELNSLYNHNKIKAMVSFTKGEGFCVKDYTKVITQGGLKRIDNIQVGDKVLSHTGNFNKVTQTMNRNYSGYMYQIVPYGGHQMKEEKETFTPNHHIQIYNKGDNSFTWKPVSEVSKDEYVCYPLQNFESDSVINHVNIFDYINTRLITSNQHTSPVDDLFVENGVIKYNHTDKTEKIKPISNKLNLNDQFGKLVGYYLSEGWVSIDSGEIIFSLHENEEKSIAAEIIDSMNQCFGLTNYNIKKYSNKKAITVHFYSKIVSNFFKNFCGSNAKNKFISSVIYNAPFSFKSNLISSLLLGDGYITEKDVEIQLVNNNVLRSLRHILFGLEIISTYRIDTIRKEKKQYSGINFTGDINILKVINEKSFNKLINIINDNHSFCSYSYKKNKRENYIGGRSPFILEDKIVFPIKEINKEYFGGKVYNIAVENDESYTLENFVVHNCRPLLEFASIGKPVIVSNWSGQLTFLSPKYSVLLSGELHPVHQSAFNQEYMGEGSKWFTVNYDEAKRVLRDVYKNYDHYKKMAQKGISHYKGFTWEEMTNELGSILEKYKVPNQLSSDDITLPE